MKYLAPGGTGITSAAIVCTCLSAAAVAQDSSSGGLADLPLPLQRFVESKKQQANELAEEFEVKVSPDIWAYFKAAEAGDWSTASNLFMSLKGRASQYEGAVNDPGVGTVVWQAVIEVELVLESYALGEPKYSGMFGRRVVDSIPAGAIYFGGTDPGRGLVTAFCKSHAQGDPFFTITQNAFADGRYLQYLRHIYGKRIYVPSEEDSQRAFKEYLEDAQRRLQENRLRPGEDVKVTDNRVQVSGQVAVMSINALLARMIFDKNPDHQFFVEESFPLDWMYPHLLPHGFILKLERDAMAVLPDEAVRKDHDFWKQELKGMIGDWLNEETPVEAVCDFADKVFRRKELDGFEGDSKYVRNDYACKLFSKLRSSIAGLYSWRLQEINSRLQQLISRESAEREGNQPGIRRLQDAQKQMLAEADFAFRQSLALCPYSPEAVFRYVNLLASQNRKADALRVASTAARLEPENKQFRALVEQLEGAR